MEEGVDDDDHDDGSGGPATSRGRSLTSPSSTAPSLERTRNTRSNPTQNEITTTAIEAAGTDQWADTYPTPGGGGRLPPGAGLHANTARSPESTAEVAAAASTAAANSGSSIPATATSTPREPPAIAVRIVVADFKMLHAAPDGRFHDAGRGGEDTKLPVIRLFGTTETGGKACLLVHGVLPYLFVPAPPGRLNCEEDLEGLAREIDAKMAEHRQAQQQRRSNEQQLAGEQPPPPQQQPHQTWRNQQQQSLVCVHGIEFTQMTRIYGYHRHAERFAKISLTNPLCKKAVVQILQAHLGFEVLEHRTEYIQQFLQDYNLRGMGWCEATQFTCRCRSSKKDAAANTAAATTTSQQAEGSGGTAAGGGAGGAAATSGALSVEVGCSTEWPRLHELNPSQIMHTANARHSVCKHEASIEAANIIKPGATIVGASQDGVLDPGLATLWQEEREYRSRVGAWDVPIGEKARLFPPTPAVERTEIPYDELTHNEKKAEDSLTEAIEADAAAVAATVDATVAVAAAAGVGGWAADASTKHAAGASSPQQQQQHSSQWRYTINELTSQQSSTGQEAMDILQGFHTDVDADDDLSQPELMRASQARFDDDDDDDDDANRGEDDEEGAAAAAAAASHTWVEMGLGSVADSRNLDAHGHFENGFNGILEMDEEEENEENEEGPSFWNSQPEFDGSDIFASQFEKSTLRSSTQGSNASAAQEGSADGVSSQLRTPQSEIRRKEEDDDDDEEDEEEEDDDDEEEEEGGGGGGGGGGGRGKGRGGGGAAVAAATTAAASPFSPEVVPLLEHQLSAAPLFSDPSPGDTTGSSGEPHHHHSHRQHQTQQSDAKQPVSLPARNSLTRRVSFAPNSPQYSSVDDDSHAAGDGDGISDDDDADADDGMISSGGGAFGFTARLHVNPGVLQDLIFRTPSPTESTLRKRHLSPPPLLSPGSPTAEKYEEGSEYDEEDDNEDDNEDEDEDDKEDEESIPASLDSVWHGSSSPNLDSQPPPKFLAALDGTVATTEASVAPNARSAAATAVTAAAMVGAVEGDTLTSASGIMDSASPDLASYGEHGRGRFTNGIAGAPSQPHGHFLGRHTTAADDAVYFQSTEVEDGNHKEDSVADETPSVDASNSMSSHVHRPNQEEPLQRNASIRWVQIGGSDDDDDILVRVDTAADDGHGTNDTGVDAGIDAAAAAAAAEGTNSAVETYAMNHHYDSLTPRQSTSREKGKKKMRFTSVGERHPHRYAAAASTGGNVRDLVDANFASTSSADETFSSLSFSSSSISPSTHVTPAGWWLCGRAPPTSKELQASMVASGIREQVNSPAFYSVAADDPKSRATLKISVINGERRSPPRARQDLLFEPQYMRAAVNIQGPDIDEDLLHTGVQQQQQQQQQQQKDDENGLDGEGKRKGKTRKRLRDAVLNTRQQTHTLAAQAGFRYASQCGSAVWIPTHPPPSAEVLLASLPLKRLKTSHAGGRRNETQTKKAQPKGSKAAGGGGGGGGRIAAPTQKNSFGFEHGTQTQPDLDETYMTVLTVEIHATSSELGMLPNPEKPGDEVVMLCYHLLLPGGIAERGMVYVDKRGDQKHYLFLNHKTTMRRVKSEKELFDVLISMVAEHDPDILVGFEIDRSSWGYLVKRAHVVGLDLMNELSRVHADTRRVANLDNAGVRYKANRTSEITITGRIVINLWRVMKVEMGSYKNYTYQNIVYHVLHQRVAWYPYAKLDQWWRSADKPAFRDYYFVEEKDVKTLVSQRWKVAQHTMERVLGCANLMKETNFVEKNSEFARLFGIQFEDVLYRGSQQRVESQMFRIARRNGFIIASPSDHNIKAMRALRIIPMLLEPMSGFYADPVLVLDFQSLYPSIMMAYNYCYSTCLGRSEAPVEEDQRPCFGAGWYRPALGEVSGLAASSPSSPSAEGGSEGGDGSERGGGGGGGESAGGGGGGGARRGLTTSPSGAMFCTDGHRKGILPQMLEEILKTRVMVKKSLKAEAKRVGGANSRTRLLDARQLALKLVANVTYGYVTASFSGRMPCSDIADAIVSKGKETLERAIVQTTSLLHAKGHTDARVIYGDTDSLFVVVPGISRERAFEIGEWLAEEVTKVNPAPVKLKFEKVYTESLMLTKKRYVGWMYEDKDQQEPVFDDKGIETVRRDTCRIQQKILESAIKILFRTHDVSQVKQYVVNQLHALASEPAGFSGAANLTDFILSAPYKGKDGYRSLVPTRKIADQKRARDPRSEPLIKERVEYVIATTGGTRMLDRAVDPAEIISNASLKIDFEYYVNKRILPCLRRAFGPMGVDPSTWLLNMPPAPRRRHFSINKRVDTIGYGSQITMTQVFDSAECLFCGGKAEVNLQSGKPPLCTACKQNRGGKTTRLAAVKVRDLERKHERILKLCRSCTGPQFYDAAMLTPKKKDHAEQHLNVPCESVACPVYFERVSASRRLQHGTTVVNALPTVLTALTLPSW